MQDEFEDNQEEYHYLIHESLCELMFTINIKYNRKRSATKNKKITSARAASHSDSDEPIRVLMKNKSSTGVLLNISNIKAPEHHGTQNHCVLFKKAGIPE